MSDNALFIHVETPIGPMEAPGRPRRSWGKYYNQRKAYLKTHADSGDEIKIQLSGPIESLSVSKQLVLGSVLYNIENLGQIYKTVDLNVVGYVLKKAEKQPVFLAKEVKED